MINYDNTLLHRNKPLTRPPLTSNHPPPHHPLLFFFSLGKNLYCLDREGKMRTLDIDTTEALFKLALERKEYAEVMRMVSTDRV